jgi:DNA-binding response OmpR family regulator
VESGEESPRPYAGAFVLWVDDHPENNAEDAAYLEFLGARVAVAEGARQAERILGGPTRVDLLISDVARGMDGDAGFTTLRRWRDSGRYDGPAIFYTDRITPNREVRCREVGAEITGSSEELYQRVDAVLRSGRRTSLPAGPNARA